MRTIVRRRCGGAMASSNNSFCNLVEDTNEISNTKKQEEADLMMRKELERRRLLALRPTKRWYI